MANKIKFKSANDVELVATSKKVTEGYRKGNTEWEIKTKEGKYIDTIHNGTGEFYSFSFGELKSIEEYIEIWKTRFIVDGFREARSRDDKNNAYMIDMYSGQGICKDYFQKLVKNIKMLLDKGFQLHYNDEHGVGHFDKVGKKYVATHHRYCNERKEDLTIEGIADFLRSFFDLGYSYTKNNEWDDVKGGLDE